MKVLAFDHTSFTVADVEKSVRFWTEQFGFEAKPFVTRTGDWPEKMTGVPGAVIKVAHLYGYGQHVEFIQYLEGAQPAPRLEPSMACVAHVCIDVADIDEAWTEMMAAGATPQGEIVQVNTSRAAYIRDPNGILIEVCQRGSRNASAHG
jgi:catechol 2,3-dioxygenase-like lactoylglutathione lyase family enzyme